MTKDKKTEHVGAKNGGGHWGSREEAKALSKKARRINKKKDINPELSLTSKVALKKPVNSGGRP